MRITDFIDLVYEDINDGLLQKIMFYLRDKRVAELSNILVIQTHKYNYLVKARYAIIDKNGNIDIQATHNYIKEQDFIYASLDLENVYCNNVIVKINIDL